MPTPGNSNTYRQMLVWLFAFIFASAFGALIRYSFLLYLDNIWATLIVNFAGSSLAGLLSFFFSDSHPQVRTLIMVFFLGSLTTFSTYSLELTEMVNNKLFTKALLYFLLTNGICFTACYLGYKTGDFIMGQS